MLSWKTTGELSRADIARKKHESSRSIICADLEEACSHLQMNTHLSIDRTDSGPRAYLVSWKMLVRFS